jgi:hypothetical protein
MLSPFLNLEKLRTETHITEKEMNLLIMSNFDELMEFCKSLKVVKENQNYLEFNPVIDGEDKIQKLRPLELKTMDMEAKVLQINDNVDNLMQSYNETIGAINQKFALYNHLLSKVEGK